MWRDSDGTVLVHLEDAPSYALAGEELTCRFPLLGTKPFEPPVRPGPRNLPFLYEL